MIITKAFLMLNKIKSLFFRKKCLTQEEMSLVLEVLAERTEELKTDVIKLEQKVDFMASLKYNLDSYTLGK